jgi:tyrosine phenol-lyase
LEILQIETSNYIKMTEQNNAIKFYSGEQIPVELHKVRIVQKLFLKPIEERKVAMEEAGFNTFLLNTKDIFLDMLTDSGTNAMSDNQVSSMLQADDAYAGSQSFYRMEAALRDVFGKHYVLPVHQGRAAENIVSQVFVQKRRCDSHELPLYNHQGTHGTKRWKSIGNLCRRCPGDKEQQTI